MKTDEKVDRLTEAVAELHDAIAWTLGGPGRRRHVHPEREAQASLTRVSEILQELRG